MVKVNCDLLVDDETARVLKDLVDFYSNRVLIANNIQGQICIYYANFNGSYNVDIPIEGVYGGVQVVINDIGEVTND